MIRDSARSAGNPALSALTWAARAKIQGVVWLPDVDCLVTHSGKYLAA